jgi:hypothetical protein
LAATLQEHRTDICPVGFVSGGGVGEYGLCAMEALNILTGCPVDDSHSEVNGFLAFFTRRANDKFTGSLAERADALWPILPRLLGTVEEFPVREYADARSYRLADTGCDCRACTYEYILSQICAGIADTPTDITEKGRLLVAALADAVDFYHAHYGTTPRQAFTPDELNRLAVYAIEHAENVYLRR